ncbi:MAG: hypothetical protein LBN95_03255 [Prevotellaceae bacterium]|jgi:hypothetical protein|nr:hypothetical protein [Prevotellaceae bacterium]
MKKFTKKALRCNNGGDHFNSNANNPKGLKFLTAAMLMCFCFGVTSAFAQSYNAAGAVQYADNWTNDVTTSPPRNGTYSISPNEGKPCYPNNTYYHNAD